MPDRSTVIYRYDGSYQGFLCCVAQCFQDKALPVSIRPYDEEQQSLYGSKDIPTRLELAQRVERSIPRRISPQALRLVREGFLTTLPEREMALLRFVLLGYKYGPPVTRMTTHPAVHALEKAVLALNNEAHHVLEFLRFADCGEFLAASAPLLRPPPQRELHDLRRRPRHGVPPPGGHAGGVLPGGPGGAALPQPGGTALAKPVEGVLPHHRRGGPGEPPAAAAAVPQALLAPDDRAGGRQLNRQPVPRLCGRLPIGGFSGKLKKRSFAAPLFAYS